MPQFNMTDEEVSVLADYLSMVMQTPAVNLASVDSKQFTPQMASLGKQLYEVKYQCQSCHTIGSAGGYVGPNLTNVGNWINAAWIEEWLKNPQSLSPEAIEPHRDFTDEERTALTAYLMTLKQSAPPRPAEDPGGANENATFLRLCIQRSADLEVGTCRANARRYAFQVPTSRSALRRRSSLVSSSLPVWPLLAARTGLRRHPIPLRRLTTANRIGMMPRM